MKIAFFEVNNDEIKYFKNKFPKHKTIFSKEKLTEKISPSMKDADIISIFIYSKINKKILDKFPNLKAIVTRSTGLDHIDLLESKKRKIKILNVPTYGENTVAEHTFALLLDLSRKIHKSFVRTNKGNFSNENLQGFDLKSKTIGLIGTGNIGKHVARIAKGFEMNVICYSLHKDLKLAKKIGFKYVSFKKLLRDSDIISLHLPLNKKTHHLINQKTINLMKKGVIIINTSRGAIIDTTALVKSLISKKIGGAGLDVLEEESIIKEEAQLLSKDFSKDNLKNLLENHILLTLDNVIITPHNAFNSIESHKRILDSTIENIHSLYKKRYNKKSNVQKK